MSKLFVVFCKNFSQPPKVLKTKNYAKSLLKKSSHLQIKQFNNQQDVNDFISQIINTTDQKPTLHSSAHQMQQENIPTIQKPVQITPPHSIKQIGSEPAQIQKIPKCSQQSIKIQPQIKQVAEPKLKVPVSVMPFAQRLMFMKYFKPSTKILQQGLPFAVTLELKQNQSPGLSEISYYSQSPEWLLNSIFLGQKHKHEAQLLAAIYALTDLQLKGIKRVIIRSSNSYVLKLLERGNTLDVRLKELVQHYKILSCRFQEISYELFLKESASRFNLRKLRFN